MPPDLTSNEMEKTVTDKTAGISWLKPSDLQRAVKVEKTEATVDGMYLRINRSRQ